MSKIETHQNGMPSWTDVVVETTEQREALMDFYTALYGWTWEVGEEMMGYYSIASLNGEAAMGIGQGPGGDGAMTVYFTTSDIAASVAKATELGATVLMEPMVIPGAGTMAMIKDPTGAAHGLWQAGDFKGFGVGYEPGAIGWFDHASKDPEAALTYYKALTGYDVLEPSPGMKVLANGDQWFASVSVNQVDDETRWNPIYVVEKLDDTKETVRSRGGTVVLEEMPVPGSAISVFLEPVFNRPVTIMGAGSHD